MCLRKKLDIIVESVAGSISRASNVKMLRIIHISLELLLLLFGALTALPVSISDNENQDAKVILDRGSTEITVARLKYIWNIKNFNVTDYVNGQRINSPNFIAHDNCQWYLFTYPKGCDKSSEKYLSLYLFLVSCKITANVRFGILNSNHEVINDKSFYYSFPKGGNLGYPNFLRQDFLLNAKNRLLENNTLNLLCEINVTVSRTPDASVKFQQSNTDDLGKDFEFLLDNEVFSDVKLFANGKDFSALKGVLAARSPVFKSLFELTPNVSQVDISDVDADVVKEMLRYIYTGKVSNLTDFASTLLVLAEKYELTRLKTVCENSMSANITIKNAAEFYILGDTYFAVNLKRQAKEFIVSHGSSAIATPGFRSLIQTHPLLVEEIFSEMAKRIGNTT